METTPEIPAEEAATPLEQIIGEPALTPDPPSDEPMEEIPPEPEDLTPAPATPQAQPEPKAEEEEPFYARKALRAFEKKLGHQERVIQELTARLAQPEPQAAPDPYQDPEGYNRAVQQTIQQQLWNQRLEFSEMRARDKFGDDTWEQTNDWLATRPDIVQWATTQRDPCGAAVQLYQREKLAAEIGDNPDQWRKEQEERIRAQVLAEVQQSALSGANPPPQQQARPMIPGPGSQARSAAPKGQWTGPTPVSAALPNKF